jgi:hypothetical protein
MRVPVHSGLFTLLSGGNKVARTKSARGERFRGASHPPLAHGCPQRGSGHPGAALRGVWMSLESKRRATVHKVMRRHAAQTLIPYLTMSVQGWYAECGEVYRRLPVTKQRWVCFALCIGVGVVVGLVVAFVLYSQA